MFPKVSSLSYLFGSKVPEILCYLQKIQDSASMNNYFERPRKLDTRLFEKIPLYFLRTKYGLVRASGDMKPFDGCDVIECTW